MDIKEINEQLNKYTESKGRLYFKLSYNGEEIDTWEISRYVGNVIPEDFDVSKFEIKVGDTQILEAMERYLSVEPCDGGFLPNTNIEYNAEVVLYEGDTVKDSIMFDINDYKTDEDIRRLAKEHFDNITDDIRVQWY